MPISRMWSFPILGSDFRVAARGLRRNPLSCRPGERRGPIR